MDVFERAAEFAVNAHRGMIRKKENIPYIMHPMEVAVIVGTMTDDREVMAAAVLHDTVEDTDVTAADIEENFGPRIVALVASETEDKRAERPPMETWRIRKEESLRELENAEDIAVKILWLGDKLSNMRSFYRLYRKEGSALWNSFNQKCPAQQAWYYFTVARLTKELSEFDAWQEYCRLTEYVFQEEKDEQHSI